MPGDGFGTENRRASEPLADMRDEAPPTAGAGAAAGIALALLMGTAAIQYAWNAVGIPALAGYDAGPHVGYILTIIETGRLPDLYSGTLTFHPPLYYLLGSRVWSLLEPAGPDAISAGLRAIGGIATLLAGVVSWFLVRARASWPVAWVATALVLFVPVGQMAAAMVGNEALAAGIPVLGSRYAGAAEELIRDGELGRLIDPLAPDSLDAALVAAVRDAQWARTSPTRLRAALEGHTSRDAADAILQAAQTVVARQPERAHP